MDDSEPDARDLLPEQRVGAALREAREARGVSLREIAKQLGYNSHTTLSGYERGSVMPTEQVVEGYERVLGLTSGTLMEILEVACVERHGAAWAKRRVHIPTQFVTAEEAPSAEEPADVRQPRTARRWALVAASVVLLLALITTAILLWASRPGANTPSGTPSSTPAAAQALTPLDQADPKVSGCAADAVTADFIEVHDPPQHLAGLLQLRYSPACGTSWSRFEPTAGLATTPPLALELNVRRPADGAAATFQVTYDGLPAYGNMLMSNHECVFAEVILHHGDVASPTFRTPCRRGAG